MHPILPPLVAAAAFAVMAREPMAHTDVWAHVAYGQWTVANGLPSTEPLLPSCRGVPMPPVDWLWNVTAYALRCLPGGSAWLILLQAGPVAIAAGLLASRMLRTSQSAIATLIGLGVAGWLLRHQLIIRPQLAGLAGYAATLWLLRLRPRRRHLAIAGVAFAFWANLHGSWPVGLVAIGLDAALGPHRRPRLAMLAVAAAAVCANPSGPLIYAGVLSVAGDAGIRDLIEWRPITETPSQLTAAIAASILLMGLLAATRRIRLADLALLVGTGAMMLDASRWIVWFAPIAGLVVADQLGRLGRRLNLRRRMRGQHQAVRLQTPGGASWSIVALAWILAFACVPLRGRVSGSTPIAAAAFLRETDVSGELFNSQELGDTLLWFGPRSAVPHLHSHVHLLRPGVWERYRDAVELRGDALGEFVTPERFAAVVLLRGRHAAAHDALVASGRWRLAHADTLTVVLLPRRASGGRQESSRRRPRRGGATPSRR